MAVLWNILQSNPRKEEFLLNQLLPLGINAYCPRVCYQPENPQARKVNPIFLGLFLRDNLEQVEFSALQWILSTKGFVAFGGELTYEPGNLVSTIHEGVDAINARCDVEKVFSGVEDFYVWV